MNNNHHVETIVEKIMMDGDEEARERDSVIIPGLVSQVESSHGGYFCSWILDLSGDYKCREANHSLLSTPFILSE